MTMRYLALAAAIVIAGTSGTAYAGPTIYNTQAGYLAAVGTTGVDTFETLSITGSTPSPITRAAGAYGYTASVSTTSFFGAGTNADKWLSTNTATDTITFTNFTGGVAGFGGFFFDSDITGAYALGSIVITVTDASGTSSFTINNATTSSFIGFVSTGGPLISATVAAVQPSTPIWPTINNLTLAGARATAGVPEPATWAMMIMGFGLMGASMRRNRKVSTRVRFA
jgi:hypothetical protein